MRIVVFGAAGFIGRNVVNRLVYKDGIQLVSTDFVDSPFASNIDYIKANILDYEDISKMINKGDVVIHLAASSLLSSLQDPKRNAEINIGGTINILDASRNNGASKFIFMSASSLIGNVLYDPVDENHPCTPKTPYGAAKKACEDYIRIYQDMYKLDYLIFRLFNVYGTYQYANSGALIPKLFNSLRSKSPFTVYGNGTASRDYIYVDDVVDFLVKGAMTDISNEIVNLGTGVSTSVMELMNKASVILGEKPNIIYQPKRVGEIDSFVADTSKLKRLFKSVPSISLEDGLEKTFSWLRANGE